MVKVEDIETMGWRKAIKGMRNPLNSWGKSDSEFYTVDTVPVEDRYLIGGFTLGPNDLDLALRLIKAGPEHRKFLRMIHIQMDITGPLYWIAEHDTYKVGTTRNSCSFMHKGTSKPFTINDFSLSDERIYYLLSPIQKEYKQIEYPYETNEYKLYTLDNGRQYKVFKNGRIVACEFSYIDSWGTGRTRSFPEKEVKPSLTKNGYFEVRLGGRSGEKWMVHRLVAHCWIPNPENLETVNHINGEKNKNNVENLEWATRADNVIKGFSEGLYDKNKLHLAYNSWKNGHTVISPLEKKLIIQQYEQGCVTREDIKEKYDLNTSQVNNILYLQSTENQELFETAYFWETVIETLNNLREDYLETKDEAIFQMIRQILPSSYNLRYTWDCSMETILNILSQRNHHRLPEWQQFRQACFDNIPCCKEFYEAMYGKEEN